MTDEAPARKRHCRGIERLPSPTPSICRSATSSMVCQGSDNPSVFTPFANSLSPHCVEAEDLSFSAEVLEKVRFYAPQTPPSFGCMPKEIVERLIEFLPARNITISCNRALYTKGYQGLYAKSDAMPTLLHINKHLRESAKTVYRPSFEGFLENGPIYVNFAVDTLIMANHEAFRTFLVPLSYSPDVKLSPKERRKCKDRYHVDNELQNLAFRTYLDTESMATLVRFRKLRWATFVERPGPKRAKTRHNKTPTVDDTFKAKTIDMWNKNAIIRKQDDFKPPEMVPVPLEGFDTIFKITERPDFPTEVEYTKPAWANTAQKRKTRLP